MKRNIFTSGWRLAAACCMLLLAGCSTDFDPNADYKETTVIYGLLDPEKTEHFVKVNKAFLNTRGNAIAIAQNNPDSITYGEEMVVVLEKLTANRDSQVVATYPLSRITVTDKESGDFYSPDQVIYTTGQIPRLDVRNIYRIRATNTRTGNVAHAATELVQDFCVNQVSSGPLDSCVRRPDLQVFPYNPHLFNMLRFTRSRNAYIYAVNLTFQYLEISGTDTVLKQQGWKILNNVTTDPNVPEFFRVEIKANSFYEHLNSVLPRLSNDSGITRKVVPNGIRIIITAGNKEMQTYWQVNNSFSFITQTRPEYDNISNGTGLFASRRQKEIPANLTSDAIDSLIVLYPQLRFTK